MKIKFCLEEFYEMMNIKAKIHGMRYSRFAVAHGMHHEANYSTAHDIGKLCCHMMKNPRFRAVVKI
jgi:D-alanyl-D-alanine carboxypeptidase